MNKLGLISDSHTVSFDCTLPGNTDWVWRHMTESDGLRSWLAEGEIEPRLGGNVRLRFQRDEALVRSNCSLMVRGVVSCYEPRRRLAYSWVDASREADVSGKSGAAAGASRVIFQLTGGQGRTLLSLTHAGLPAALLPKVGAGWHAHLALLANVLSSEDVESRNVIGYRVPVSGHSTYIESGTAGVRI